MKAENKKYLVYGGVAFLVGSLGYFIYTTLRNKNSIEMLLNFCANSQILLNSFKIYSNIGNIKYSYNDLYNKSRNV